MRCGTFIRPHITFSHYKFLRKVTSNTLCFLFYSVLYTTSAIPDVSFSYTNNSPRVSGTTVSFNLEFGSGVMSASCALIIGNGQPIEIDCK